MQKSRMRCDCLLLSLNSGVGVEYSQINTHEDGEKIIDTVNGMGMDG